MYIYIANNGMIDDHSGMIKEISDLHMGFTNGICRCVIPI